MTSLSQEAPGSVVAPRLPLLRLELVFAMDEPVELPAFRGNLWRGVLGPALKRIDEGVLPGLSTGEVAPGTLYRTFFESPPPPEARKMRLYDAVPHPYVVDAPSVSTVRRIEAGARERIGLTLIGRPATAVEAVLAAFDFAARVGLGARIGEEHERGRARLVEASAVWRDSASDAVVYDETAGFRPIVAEVPAVPLCPTRLRVTIATPLRLKHEGRPLRARPFRPGALVANLVRRVSMLCEFFGDTPLDTDFAALKSMWTNLVAREPMLADADQTRWSGNRQQEFDMSGVIGSFVLDMRGVEALFPYLWLGQWIHAGKGSVTGMGAIRVKAE
jgi:CRISPR-associated endoribonuclease Cas6